MGFSVAFATLLLLALVGGGSPWAVGDVLSALLAVVLVYWAFLRQLTGKSARWQRMEWGALAVFALLMVTQALPLPAAAWMPLHGGYALAKDLAAASVSPTWRTLGVDPPALFRRLAALLPALALLVCVRGLSPVAVRWLLRGLLLFGCVSVLFGIAQAGGGPDSPLRLYAFHNRVGALGFFAYRNAQATFLMMFLPIAFAQLYSINGHSPARVALRQAAVACAMALLLLGLAMTYSRAGVVLGAATMVACVLLIRPLRGQPGAARARLALVAGCLAGGVLVLGYALSGLLERHGEGLLSDARWDLYRGIGAYAFAWLPVGAGLGSFTQVFQDSAQNQALAGAYFNQAHNDWLQLTLELGALFWVLAAVGLTVAGRAAQRVWMTPRPANDLGLVLAARAASVSLLAAMAHACFDYTLHSGANLALFAFLAGLLLRVAQVDLPAFSPALSPALSQGRRSPAAPSSYNRP